MSLQLNPSGDLLAVADGLQTITIYYSASDEVEEVQALPRKVTRREAEASGGRYTAADLHWHLPNTLAFPLALGDEILDPDDNIWIVQEIRTTGLGGRLQVVTRKLAIAPTPDQTLTLQLATWSKTATGAALAEWNDVDTELLAHIQPRTAKQIADQDRRTQRATHDIYLATSVTLTANHRFRDASHNTYDPLLITQTQRIDAHTAIEVVQHEANPSP